MVKKSSRINYRYDGKNLNIRQIYAGNKKRRGRSKYLLSVLVDLNTKDSHGNDTYTPAKTVCVRNRTSRKDWIALISTDVDLSETEIICIYGKWCSICWFRHMEHQTLLYTKPANRTLISGRYATAFLITLWQLTQRLFLPAMFLSILSRGRMRICAPSVNCYTSLRMSLQISHSTNPCGFL